MRVATRKHSAWLILSLSSLLLFLIDLVAVQRGWTWAQDRTLELQARGDFGHGTLGLFQLLSFIGGASVRIALLIVLALFLLWRRHWLLATLLTAASAGSGVLNLIVKDAVARSRPHLFAGAEHAAGYSFPSGHAMDAVVFFGTIAYLAWRLTGKQHPEGIFAIPVLILAALIGLSRVVLGVHYPSDVVGGWLLGAAWLGAVIIGFSLWAARMTP